MLREIAEELVSGDPSFSEEYRIFLENISQPIQLLQLIADDFETEFGPDAQRGLLAVGDAGGDNIMSIMDFCAAKKPSELLARVKQRVVEKHERERRTQEISALRSQIKELDTQIRGLLLDYRSGEIGPERTLELQKELEKTLDQRDAVKKEVEDLQAAEDQEVRDQKREKMERDRRLASVGIKIEETATSVSTPVGASLGSLASMAYSTPIDGQDALGDEEEEKENIGFKLGSSRDLLKDEIPSDPFAATAPRAVSPMPGSRKGKAKALVQPGKVRRIPLTELSTLKLNLVFRFSASQFSSLCGSFWSPLQHFSSTVSCISSDSFSLFIPEQHSLVFTIFFSRSISFRTTNFVSISTSSFPTLSSSTFHPFSLFGR